MYMCMYNKYIIMLSCINRGQSTLHSDQNIVTQDGGIERAASTPEGIIIMLIEYLYTCTCTIIDS